MILADIGNSNIHILDKSELYHLNLDEAIKRYAKKEVLYICVDRAKQEIIEAKTKWQDISSKIILNGAYSTMGVDRRALCLSYENGLFIDSGSATTIDLVENGYYQGGFITLGFYSYFDSFLKISPALEMGKLEDIDIDTLPKGTLKQLSYGIIAPLLSEIKRVSKGLPIYITGGGGKILASYLKEATYDETLIFRGIKRALSLN